MSPLAPVRTTEKKPVFVSPDGRFELGRRICIYGRGGKTTLSRRLGELTGLHAIELDAIAWLPDWQLRPSEEFAELVQTEIDSHPEGWIMDGSYSRIRATFLPLADTVIWLHMGYWTGTWRILKRTIRHGITGEKLCGDNTESLLRQLRKDSFIWWTLRHAHKTHHRTAAALAEIEFDANVYELRSPGELNEFYRSFGLTTP